MVFDSLTDASTCCQLFPESNISNVFCTIGDELASEPICESTNIIDNSTWYIDTSYIPTSLGGTAENWVCWVCNSSNGNLYGVNKSFEEQGG